MKQPFGIVLAGGLARRMGGGAKGLLPIGEQRIIDHVLQRLEPQVADIAINANDHGDLWSEFGHPVIADTVSDYPGPLAGVLAGMEWAASQGATHIVTVAGDTPFYPGDLVPQLMLAADNAGTPIALAATMEGEKMYRHPTFGIWSVSLADDLRKALNDGIRKVVQWTDGIGCAQAVFPVVGVDPFFNINTSEDLAKARDMV